MMDYFIEKDIYLGTMAVGINSKCRTFLFKGECIEINFIYFVGQDCVNDHLLLLYKIFSNPEPIIPLDNLLKI